MLRPVGRKQQKLRHRSYIFLGLEEHFAKPAAEWRTSRFTSSDQVHALLAEVAREHTQLRGLAASVNALKSYELSLQYCVLSGCDRYCCCCCCGCFLSCETVEMACLKIKTSCPPTS